VDHTGFGLVCQAESNLILLWANSPLERCVEVRKGKDAMTANQELLIPAEQNREEIWG